MNVFGLLTLLALLLSGCRIDTVVTGEGTVTSSNGAFNCDQNGGDCTQQYTNPGTETLIATPDPGYTFSRWVGCNYQSLITCLTPITQEAVDGDLQWTITAEFKPIKPPVQAATYTYNALGQRITRTVAGTTTIFQYDMDGTLIAELGDSGQPLRQHIHVNSQPIAQLSTNPGNGKVSVQYVHTDHLGAPSLLTDGQKTIVWDIEATPFGETFIDYAAVEHKGRFPGQYKDEESGLHYNYFRDYDPGVGRYIQSDPIGLQGGVNTYNHVGGNPLVYVDPLGLLTVTIEGNIHIPAWVSRALKYFGVGDVPVNGIRFGTADSFPFFDGAERDTGILVGADIPGADFGLGKTSISLGLSKGSVCDISTNSEENYSFTVPGLDIGFSRDKGSFSGVHIGPGFGLNAGVAGKYTGVYSEKHGMLGPK